MKKNKPKICIFGAGRVGGTLLSSLNRNTYKVDVLIKKGVNKSEYSASNNFIEFSEFVKKINSYDIIILSVPDTKIESAVKQICNNIQRVNKKIIVLHTSGTISYNVFQPLGEKGFIIGSLHPYFSFYKVRKDVKIDEIRFSLSCAKRDLSFISSKLSKIGIKPVFLNDNLKTPYHISAVLVSNFSAMLIRIAFDLLLKAGFGEKDAEDFIFSLLNSTLNNLNNFGIRNTITGPAIRRDKKILKLHKEYLGRSDRTLMRFYSYASNLISEIYR